MKGKEVKKETKKEKAEVGANKVLSEYQKEKASRQNKGVLPGEK